MTYRPTPPPENHHRDQRVQDGPWLCYECGTLWPCQWIRARWARSYLEATRFEMESTRPRLRLIRGGRYGER